MIRHMNGYMDSLKTECLQQLIASESIKAFKCVLKEVVKHANFKRAGSRLLTCGQVIVSALSPIFCLTLCMATLQFLDFFKRSLSKTSLIT